MYTTAFPQRTTSPSYASQATGNEIPNELLASLMENAERQIVTGDYITQGEMEKLVAAW